MDSNWEDNIYNEDFTKEVWGEWETEASDAENVQTEAERCNNEYGN